MSTTLLITAGVLVRSLGSGEKARQVCEGGFCRRTMDWATVT